MSLQFIGAFTKPACIAGVDAQARDLVEFPTSAAKAAVRCPRVRADRSPADRAAVPPASAPLRRKRAVAHDGAAQFSTVVTPALGAGHPVDRVHRSSVPGGNPWFSPKISEVKATDQQRPAQAPAAAHWPTEQADTEFVEILSVRPRTVARYDIERQLPVYGRPFAGGTRPETAKPATCQVSPGPSDLGFAEHAFVDEVSIVEPVGHAIPVGAVASVDFEERLPPPAVEHLLTLGRIAQWLQVRLDARQCTLIGFVAIAYQIDSHAVNADVPCEALANLLAISEFPKWRKYLILLSFLDNSSARPVQIGGVDVNICHSRSTAVRGRRRSSSQSPPRGPFCRTRTGPVEADGAVDAQNAPTAPWKTLCVFHELPQGLSHQVTHEKLRKAPKYRWETRIDPISST